MDFIGSYVLNNNSFHKKDDDVFCYFSCLGYYFSDFFRRRDSTYLITYLSNIYNKRHSEGNIMTNEELYKLLIDSGIYTKTDVEETKIFEYDIVIEDHDTNKKFKVETNNMSRDDIMIALLAKQTLYVKTIRNIIVGTVTFSIICALLLYFVYRSVF